MATVAWTRSRWRGDADRAHPARYGQALRTVRLAARRVPWRAAAHWLLLAAALTYLAWRAPAIVGQFSRASGHVEHMRWEWIGVAALCGIGGLIAYGEVNRQLLLVGGARLSMTTVQGINFAQNAVSATVPVVGNTGSLGYAVDQLRRRGVDTIVAAWSVLMTGLVTSVTLLVLGAVGLAWAGRIPWAAAIVMSAVLIVGVTGSWLLLTHTEVLHRGRHRLSRRKHGTARLSRVLPATWADRTDSALHRLADQIASLRPSGPQWAVLIGVAVLSWVLDFLTLVASAAATDSRARTTVLVVGFLLVQGSIALQVLPGGAGLAEAGLIGVLLGAGVGPAAAVATALIYRVISWLGLSAVGWVSYALRHPHTGQTSPAQVVYSTPVDGATATTTTLVA